MAKYILLEKNRRKAPLLGTKSKPYIAKIDDNIVTKWYLMDEAWLVTNVYMNNKTVVAQSLRAIHPDVGPNEINKFIEIVKNDHPLEFIIFNWNDIPLYATAKSYCELDLPWLYKNSIKLTQEQEKGLLEIVQDKDGNKKLRMTRWFYWYRSIYGIDARLKRDRETQDEELASIFCLVHGFSLNTVSSISCKTQKQEQEIELWPGIRNIFLFILVFAGTLGLAVWGIGQDGIIFPLLSTLPFCLVLKFIGILAKSE